MNRLVVAAFDVHSGSGPVVSTAIHAGHHLRPDVAERVALDAATRRREEDPYTDRLIADLGTGVVVHRSRFEVDINRPRAHAVYREPDDAWGLDVWNGRLPARCVRRSLALYDDFYRKLATQIERVTIAGPCLVLDVHSYNHRRDGRGRPPAPESENPEVNVGTGPLDRALWGSVADAFIGHLGGEVVVGHRLDVRENVRFEGGHLGRWVAERYATTACCLAIEFKKTFMDELTGIPDHAHLGELAAALRTAVDATVGAFAAGAR